MKSKKPKRPARTATTTTVELRDEKLAQAKGGDGDSAPQRPSFTADI